MTSRDAHQWAVAVEALRAFAEQHGHTYPPADMQLPDGRSLETWLANVRYKHHKGLLSADRVAELEAIPHFVWRTRKQRTWYGTGRERLERQVGLIEQYVAENAAVPRRGDMDEGRIGEVVAGLRREYHTGNLPPALASRLEAVPGWVWQARTAADDTIREIAESSQAAGYLTREQRAFLRKYRDRAEAAALLERYPLEPRPIGEAALAEITDHLAKHGRYPRGRGTASRQPGPRTREHSLAETMSRWRRAYRDGELDLTLAAKLEALPGWEWNPQRGGPNPEKLAQRIATDRLRTAHAEEFDRLVREARAELATRRPAHQS